MARRSRPGGAEEPDVASDPDGAARAIALRQLTAAPRSRAQLERAMARRQVPEEAAERVLDRFEDVGLVDDAAFAGMVVRSRHATRGLARRAIAQELRHKGVDDDVAREALAAELDDEAEEVTARALVGRRLRSTRGLERDKRIARLAGALARKGYPSGLALRVVKEALAAEGEDVEDLAGLGDE